MEAFIKKDLNDWEIIDLITLQATLETFSFTDQELDKLLWGKLKGPEIQSNKVTMLCSQNGFLGKSPWRYIWRTKTPLKSLLLYVDSSQGSNFNSRQPL